MAVDKRQETSLQRAYNVDSETARFVRVGYGLRSIFLQHRNIAESINSLASAHAARKIRHDVAETEREGGKGGKRRERRRGICQERNAE